MNASLPSLSISGTSLRQECIVEKISATRRREAAYVTCDWLRHDGSSGARRPLHENAIDRDCRSKMVGWCVQVAAFCKFRHETVEITMSLLDRFLSTPAGTAARNDRAVYQLACMAALYTAAKIHETMAIPPRMLARFSHGMFTPQDIERMEAVLLGALKWRVNPPTSYDYIRMLMELVSTSEQITLNPQVCQVVKDLANFQAELAVADDHLMSVPASTVAYAAVTNALDSLELDARTVGCLRYTCAQSLQIDCNARQVNLVQNILYQAVAREKQQENLTLGKQSATQPVGSKCPVSPRSALSVEISPRAVLHA